MKTRYSQDHRKLYEKHLEKECLKTEYEDLSNQPESSKREDINYEDKGIPIPKNGIFPIQEMEHKIANHLRKALNLD